VCGKKELIHYSQTSSNNLGYEQKLGLRQIIFTISTQKYIHYCKPLNFCVSYVIFARYTTRPHQYSEAMQLAHYRVK